MKNNPFLHSRFTDHLPFLALLVCLLVVTMVPFSTVDAQVLAAAATETSVTLTWSAPGDDGSTGRASSYDLRYWTVPITDINWSAATLVTNEPAPKPAGQTEVFTIQNLPPNFTYCFALKTADEVPNWAPLSNSITVILPPTPVSTVVDTVNGSATMTCAQVTSYFTLTYQFALDTSSSFSSPTIRPGGISGSNAVAQFTGLESRQNYYWRCRALAADLSDTSSWSSDRVFSYNNPPSAPVNFNPTDGSTITDTPITLTVTNAVDPDGDALTYSFWIASDASFTTIVASQANIAEGSGQTSITFSSFSPISGQQYWWRCRAGDGELVSNYSSATWFLYAPPFDSCQVPPSTPALISPSNGGDAGSQQPTLCVANSQPSPGCTNPLVYTFEVYTDAGLTTPVVPPSSVNEGSDSTCYTFPSSLPTGRFFYWRVRCSNGTAASSWSPTFLFYTPNTPPGVPALVTPADGDTVTTLAPELSVSAVTDPDGTTVTYLFEVSPSANFSTLASNGQVVGGSGTITWRVEQSMEDSSIYYWRARTTDNIDYSSYSSARSFVVAIPEGNNAPTAPSPSSPPANSIVDTLEPTLIVLNGFDADGDPLTYQFQLYNQTGDSLLASAAGITEGLSLTAWTVPEALEDSTTYLWRASCFDGVTYSPWTSLIEFTVDLGLVTNQPPSLPTHLSPSNGDTIIATPIVLSVENAVDPEGDPLWYDFWIYSDATLTQLVESQLSVPETLNQTAATFVFTPVSGQRYWWQVQVTDGTNTTGPTTATWFDYWEFATGGNEYTAGAVGPSNGAVILTGQPTLTAANITAAGENYYYFEVATDSSFSNPVLASPGIPETESEFTEWQVDERLESGREYYWHVQADTFAYSSVASFYVEVAVYAAPNPVHIGDIVTFHLPDSPVDLLIITVSGETVLVKKGVSGEWEWDLRNAGGRTLAVGIYLWFVRGTEAEGKIVIEP